MDSEARNPDTARLRLVDLRIDGEHLLHFGGGFSCVLAENGSRSTAARAIAYTVVGPRPSGASGAIDIGGTLVSVWSLPSPMLPRDTPVVIDRDLVWALWDATCARRRGRLAAEHAACHLEGQNIEAELERLGVKRPVEAVLDEQPEPEPVAEVAAPQPADPDAELAAFMQSVQTYGTVESLVAALEPEPLPEAMHLAELVDTNVAMSRARDEVGDNGVIDLDAAERRVKLARIEVAMASGSVGAAERIEIERRHRAVVEAEAHLSEVGRRRRPRAAVRYDAAVAAEQKALADAGIDSYAMFLMALTAGETRPDERALRVAQEELAVASEAYDRAQQMSNLPSRAEINERAVLLRDHARAMLGREPGRDLANDLRTVRVPRADHAERLRELTAVLTAAGVAVGADPLADARGYLMSPPSIHIEQKPAWPMPEPRGSGRLDQDDAFVMPGISPEPVQPPIEPEPPAAPQPTALELAAIETLERQHADQQRRLADLEAEMRGLEALRGSDLSQLAPEAFARAVAITLSAYRAGIVLAGRAPLVFDGVLDRISPDTCDAAVKTLADAADVQSIVVSNDPHVMQRIRDAGGTIVHWPESERQEAAQFTG